MASARWIGLVVGVAVGMGLTAAEFHQYIVWDADGSAGSYRATFFGVTLDHALVPGVKDIEPAEFWPTRAPVLGIGVMSIVSIVSALVGYQLGRRFSQNTASSDQASQPV